MVFEFPGQSTISGKYEGPERFRAFWKRIFERYETFRLTPKRIALDRPYALGLTNTAPVEWVAVAVTHDGLTMHAEGVAVVELRRGKLVHARDYFSDPSVLDAVWGRRPEGRETPESMRMVPRQVDDRRGIGPQRPGTAAPLDAPDYLAARR